jgi:hypothetical protein
MAIKTGRYGRVRYAPAGVISPAGYITLASINAWKLSLKTDYEDVSCFGDTNKVYVPGLRDVSGSFGGFLNISDLTIIAATSAASPGSLELTHNTTDTIGSPLAAPTFSGLAYLDADIDCGVNGAPKLSSTFVAAGSWTLPA